MTRLAKLRRFVTHISRLIECAPGEAAILDQGRRLPADLAADAYAPPHPQYYRQHLIYADPLDRLSTVSVVWGQGQGQETPVHDHRFRGPASGAAKGFASGESNVAMPNLWAA